MPSGAASDLGPAAPTQLGISNVLAPNASEHRGRCCLSRRPSLRRRLRAGCRRLRASAVARHLRERQLVRWNLLWLALIAVCATLPLWLGSDLLRRCSVLYWAQVLALYSFAAVQSVRTLLSMAAEIENGSRRGPYPDTQRAAELRHIVLMCAYKEPLELLEKTVQTVAEQTVAHRVVMVIALEEGTPAFARKEEALRRAFRKRFDELLIWRHPRGVPGEIAGKCSNSNYAMRQTVAFLEREAGPAGFDPTLFTATTCDADSCFDRRYLEALGDRYLAHERPAEVVWQPPLFYNYGLAEAAFFTRCTAILRSFFMMGFLIPMSINTMSIFSFSLSLCIDANYMHPGYQMDDIIYTLSCMRATRKRVVIEPICLPTLSGPTSGATVREELHEWARQAKRWSIGAAEVFHYFLQSLLEGKFELRSGLGYGAWYTWYYAIILCGGPVFGLLSHTCFHGRVLGVVMAWLRGRQEEEEEPQVDGGVMDGVVLGCVVGQYLIFGLAHLLDAWFTRLTDSKEPPIGLTRRVAHWLATGPTLLLYSFVSFYGVLEIAVCGKAVCTHDPSKKDSLSDTLSNAATRESGGNGIGGLERPQAGKCVAGAEGSEDGSSSSEDGSEEG